MFLLCFMTIMAGCETGHVIEIMVPDTQVPVERRLEVEQALYAATNAVAKEMGMFVSWPPRSTPELALDWEYGVSYNPKGGPSGFYVSAKIHSDRRMPEGARVSVIFRAMSDQADMAVTEKAFGIFAKEFNKLGLGYVVRRDYNYFRRTTRTEIKPSQ